MIGKLLNFQSKKQARADIDVVIAQIELGPDKAAKLQTLLNELKSAEKAMQNPLLKDWMAIRNNIRKVERKINESRYEKL